MVKNIGAVSMAQSSKLILSKLLIDVLQVVILVPLWFFLHKNIDSLPEAASIGP